MNAHPQRLHALDNLRASMMWLGIVLHVAVNHVAGPSPVRWRDDRTTPWADLLVAFIHAFRMPVFFVLAGFFVAMLVATRGHGGMFKHRMLRLALPFGLLWPPIYAGMITLIVLFLHRMAYGTWGMDETLLARPGGPPKYSTMHLWFLYQLLWFVVLTAALGAWRHRFPPTAREAVARWFGLLGGTWWGIAVLALPLAVAGAFYRNGIVTPGGSFLPPWTEWVHNGMFYVLGYGLHRHQQALFARWTRSVTAHAVAGLACFIAALVLVELNKRSPTPYGQAIVAFIYGCASWCWSFALIGAFLRWLPRQNGVLRYLSQSSYWVYLVHMLGTIGFGVLLFGTPLSAWEKMAINIVATSAVCLLSYQLFVRHTPIGWLLNGRPAAARPQPGNKPSVRAACDG